MKTVPIVVTAQMITTYECTTLIDVEDDANSSDIAEAAYTAARELDGGEFDEVSGESRTWSIYDVTVGEGVGKLPDFIIRDYDSEVMGCFSDGARLSTPNGYVNVCSYDIDCKADALDSQLVGDLVRSVDTFDAGDHKLFVVWDANHKYIYVAIDVPDAEIEMDTEMDALWSKLDKHLDNDGITFE